MHVPDPSAVLRTQSAAVRPGGIVAPIESDISRAPAGESGTELGQGSARAGGNGDSAGPPPMASPRASRAHADPGCSLSNRISVPAIRWVTHSLQASSELCCRFSSAPESQQQTTSTSTRSRRDCATTWRQHTRSLRSRLSRAHGQSSSWLPTQRIGNALSLTYALMSAASLHCGRPKRAAVPTA
jgi:hypothetical protein